jgi:acyl carrier protein
MVTSDMSSIGILHQEGDASIRSKVCTYLAEYFMADISMEDHVVLVDDLGADSLDLLQVVHMLNDMFLIEINVDFLSRMLTVGGVCEVVEQLCLRREISRY